MKVHRQKNAQFALHRRKSISNQLRGDFDGCWKWFDGVLKEANVTVTDKNKTKVDDVIHKYIGEQSSYGNCSTDWKKARVQINENPKMKAELVAKLKALA